MCIMCTVNNNQISLENAAEILIVNKSAFQCPSKWVNISNIF